MVKLDVLNVTMDRVEPFSLYHYLVGRCKHEFRVLVDEFPDEPRAGDAIDFHMFTGNSLHLVLLVLCHASA